MPLFKENKRVRVQRVVLKLVNNHCPEMKASMEGPRLDNRVNLVVVVMVIPMEDDKLQLHQAFTALTKEFSNSGLAVVLDRPQAFEQVVLGFQFEGEMTFVRSKARHLNPMGGGFYQLGFQLLEVLSVGDYPELDSLSL
jgi:hypothetical protein